MATYNTIEVRSLGTHLGFYADPREAVYMHHKDCKPEHITRLHQESSLFRQEVQHPTEKVLHHCGHVYDANVQHFYVDDAGQRYVRGTGDPEAIPEHVEVVPLGENP